MSLTRLHWHQPAHAPQRWFCVEDCSNAARPVVLLSVGSLPECHDFIERCRQHGRAAHLRVNYSPAMRRYLEQRGSDAA
jgi:hypothetical protein